MVIDRAPRPPALCGQSLLSANGTPMKYQNPHARPTGEPVYQGNILRFYLFIGLTGFVLWTPIWVVFFERRGLSLSQIGLLEVVAFGLLAVSEVPTGTVADVWGRKVSMAIGAILHGVAVLGILTEVLSPIFLVAYAIWGVSFSFVTGAGEAFAYDSLKADGRVDAYPKVASRHAIIRQAAGGMSGVVGGLVAAYDLRLCFILTAVACFAGAGVILTGHEPASGEAEDPGGSGYWRTLRSGLRIVTGDRYVRVVVLIGALVSLVTTLLAYTAFQPYADEVGMPVWTFGGILLGMELSGIGGSYVAPRVVTRRTRERLLAVALLAVAGCLILLWVGASRPAVILFAVTAALTALARPVLSSMLNDLIPSRQRATVISIESLIAMLGCGLVQLALFAIADRTNMAFALGLAGLLMVIAAVPLLRELNRSAPASVP